jgi:NAD(P)-dependent dehydrogenase (short-subunit alcohol dehydrogenase family)
MPAGAQALVVGAASGIGRATAAELVRRGAKVALLDRVEAEVAAVASQIGGDTRSAAADVRDRPGLRAALASLLETAPLDILVYSAGVHRVGPPSGLDEATFDELMGVNARGFAVALQEALPYLRAAGGARHVVAVSSASARSPKVLSAGYAASKAALEQLVKTFAAELAPEGIRVNAVAPGTVDTPMLSRAIADGAGFSPTGAAPLGRLANAADIAMAIAFLCSAEADFVAGHVLAVDGGAGAAIPASSGAPGGARLNSSR